MVCPTDKPLKCSSSLANELYEYKHVAMAVPAISRSLLIADAAAAFCTWGERGGVVVPTSALGARSCSCCSCTRGWHRPGQQNRRFDLHDAATKHADSIVWRAATVRYTLRKYLPPVAPTFDRELNLRQRVSWQQLSKHLSAESARRRHPLQRNAMNTNYSPCDCAVAIGQSHLGRCGREAHCAAVVSIRKGVLALLSVECHEGMQRVCAHTQRGEHRPSCHRGKPCRANSPGRGRHARRSQIFIACLHTTKT